MIQRTLVLVLAIGLALSCDSSDELSDATRTRRDGGEARSRSDASERSSGVDARDEIDAATPTATDLVDAASAVDAETSVDAAIDEPVAPVSEPPPAATGQAGATAIRDDVDPGERCYGPPGLYADGRCEVPAPGVRHYAPQFPLWADGAGKERFIYLPPGTKIDTRNPNRWSFPVGTVFYKTFSLNGLRLETRVLQKVGTGVGYANWNVDSYAWNADQRSVTIASTNGVRDALGTTHDIPSTAQCRQCHNQTGLDPINGFGAIQLNHRDSPLTLETLLREGLLMNGTSSAEPNVSLTNATLPGDATIRAGLGYLHANCGHCHGGPTPRAQQQLWSLVGTTQLTDTPIFRTAVCRCLSGWTGRVTADGVPYELRVAPGHSAISGLIGRMSRRTRGDQMPPVGTSIVDPAGIAAVSALIDALDPTNCDDAPPDCSPPDADDAGVDDAGALGVDAAMSSSAAGAGDEL